MNFVVAYDGSDGARRAAQETVPLARATNGALVLVHVLDSRVAAAGVQAPSTDEAMKVVIQTAEKEAGDFAQGLMAGARVRVEVQDRGEDRAEAIIRIADQEQAGAIAIATRRAGGLTGSLLGSVTQQLIRDSHRPVLVIKA